MEVLYKQGVMGDLQPKAAEGLRQCAKFWALENQDVMVVTSIRDGTHGYASFHPSGRAFDLRLPVNVNFKQFVERLKKYLGNDFDVVLENDHIHTEYDPKLGTVWQLGRA